MLIFLLHGDAYDIIIKVRSNHSRPISLLYEVFLGRYGGMGIILFARCKKKGGQ